MNKRIGFQWSALVLVVAGMGWATGDEAPAVLRLSVDREGAVYAIGEVARVTVAAERNGAPVATGEVAIRLIRDFRREAGTQTLPLRNGEATFTCSLDEPGFLTVQAQPGNAADMARPWVFALPNPKLTVAFSPERIAPAVSAPDDFDAFWAEGRAQLADIPLDPVVVPVRGRPVADAFKISLANVDGTRVWGFLSVPKDREGPFPLLVTVPGANFQAPSAPPFDWGDKGVMRLVISVHPHDPESTAEQYRELAQSGAGNYTRMGAPDRERYYFRRAILGADRLLDFVCAEYPWDGRHCVVGGHSQGGAFALFIAGFNRRVTACMASAPALCDHAGYTVGRGTGWPNLASYQEPDLQAATLRMSGYFDAVHFAARIRVPTLMTVGFLDATCPPSSVYAAFNRIAAPKRMIHQVDRGHGMGQPAFTDYYQQTWLPEMLGLNPPGKE